MNEMKRLYSIITNPQVWRTSLTTSPTPESKQNATADSPADDSSTYEDCRSQVLSSDEASSQSSGAIYAAPASLTDRLRPEGEASAESCRSSEMYSDVDIDDAESDTSETYKILDTSKHSADVEKRYQNLVDMSEELQMIRATPEIKSNVYDVPRITFTFFDEKKLNDDDEVDNNYEILNIKPLIYARPVKQSKCKTELKITLSQANVANRIDFDQNINSQATAETSLKNKNSCVNMSKSHDNLSSMASRQIKSQININLSKSTGDISNVNREQKTRSNSFDKLVTSTKTLQLTKTVTFMTTEKRTSRSLGDIIDGQSEEVVKYPLMSLENLPRSIEEKRNEAADDADVVQVLSGDEEADLEYCRARNKLPARIRRATLIKKTQVKSRAVDTWSTFRSRLSNLITTQAAAQRVGAQSSTTATVHYDEYPKAIGKSVDKMYKKTKKLVLPKINGRIFVKRGISKDKENFQDTFSDDGILYHRDQCAGMKDNGSCDGGGSDVTITAVNNCDGGDNKCDNQRRGVNECAISELDLTNVRTTPFRRSKQLPSEGQNGFDDLRRYIKQGGDFCKELSAVLQERSEAELQYAKSLSKLSNKLSRACREGVGGINDAWKSIAAEMETRADIHRQFSATLCEEIVKPLRQLTEAQHKTRKQSEGAVDKSARSLGEWRTAEAKSKKQSHTCARENEKLQDTLLDVRLSRSTSLIHLSHLHSHKTVSDRETAKLEVKKRKAENAVKKADIEYYTLCVRSERARLEWESAVLHGAGSFQSLEEERLNNLKLYLASYLTISSEMTPRLIEITDGLRAPIAQSEPGKDLQTFLSLRNSSQHVPEQLLPDFYCEHITLAMNRERRKQALVKILQLIRQDLDRERKSKHGLENLSRAIKQTPNFGSEDSQQTVSEKLYHMRSMLTYLEGARYKVQSALAEIDNRQRIGHPLASHISITRDKSGLQQSILKVPPWLRDEAIKPLTAPTNENADNDDTDWSDRGMGDGNSNQPDSDFDEFSSQTSGGSESAGSSHTIATEEPPTTPLCHCKALYAYTANLGDEISLRPGDVLAVYRQQPDGWWLGECNGSVGIFPATYVEQID